VTTLSDGGRGVVPSGLIDGDADDFDRSSTHIDGVDSRPL